MINFLLADGGAVANSWWLYVVLLGFVVLMIVLPMFTQKKKYKEYSEMVEGLHIGDEVKTIGGIIGKIIKINKEQGAVKSIVVESGLGATKSTLEFDINCIAMVLDQVKVKEEVTETEENADATKEQPVEKTEEATETKTQQKPKKSKKSSK